MSWITVYDEDDIWKIVCTPHGVWMPPRYQLVHHCPEKEKGKWSATYSNWPANPCAECGGWPSDKMKLVWELADKWEETDIVHWYGVNLVANFPKQMAKITGLTAYFYGKDDD